MQRCLADKVRRGTFTKEEVRQYRKMTKCGGWLKQESDESWKARLARDRLRQQSKSEEEKAAISRKRKACRDVRSPEEKDLRQQIGTLQQQLRRCQYMHRFDYSRSELDQRWAAMEKEKEEKLFRLKLKLQKLIGGNPNCIKKEVQVESGEQMDQRYEQDRARHAEKRKLLKLELDQVKAEMKLERDISRAKAIVVEVAYLNKQRDQLMLEAEKFEDCPVCFKGYRYFPSLESFAQRDRCIREDLYKKYRCSKTRGELASCYSNVAERHKLARLNQIEIRKLERELQEIEKRCRLCMEPRCPLDRCRPFAIKDDDHIGTDPPGFWCECWEVGQACYTSDIEQWDEIPFGPFQRWEEEIKLYKRW